MWRRRLCCVTLEISCPSIRISPDFEVVEAQQQIDERALARAAAADQADFLARRNDQVQPFDHPALAWPAAAAVMEAYVAELDRSAAARDLQFDGAGRVHHRIGLRDGLHALLDPRQSLENPGDLVADPARHVHHLPGHRHDHHRDAGGNPARLPLRQSQRRRADQQADVQPGMGDAHQPDLVQGGAETVAVAFELGEIGRRFLTFAAEQLHQADIDEDIVDMADERGVIARMGELEPAHGRQEIDQRRDEGGQPDQGRRRQPDVEAHHGDDRGEDEEAAIPDRAHGAAQRIAQSRAAVHHLVGEPAGEIIGEIGHGMAERVAGELVADQIVETRGVLMVIEPPQQSHAAAPAEQHRDGDAPQPRVAQHVARRARAGNIVDQPADHHRNHRRAGGDAGFERQQDDEQAFDLAHEMPDEWPQARGRRPVRRSFEGDDFERHDGFHRRSAPP